MSDASNPQILDINCERNFYSPNRLIVDEATNDDNSGKLRLT